MVKNIKLLIISLVLVTITAIIIIITLYVTTDLFKSKEILFEKYLGQGIANVVDVFDFSDENEFIKLIENNDYTENADIKLSYIEEKDDEEEIYNIKAEGAVNHSENKAYKKIKANYNDVELAKINLLKQEDLLGFRFSNLVKQYVSFKNSNLSYVISSMGYEGQYFSETLSEVKLQDLIELTDDEIKKIEQTYLELIFSDISKESYSSKNDVIITLSNGESPTTKAYTITLTKNEIDNIYKKIINQAMQDEIILSKINKLDEKIEEAGFIEQEGESIKDIYINKLKSLYDNIEYEGQDDRKYEYTVYQSNRNTVRISIKTDKYEANIDFDNNDGNYVSLKIKENTEEGEDISQYSLGKKNIEGKIERTMVCNYEGKEIETKVDISKLNNNINMEIQFDFSDETIQELTINAKKEIELGTVEKYPIKFTDKNNIILNEYEGEEINDILKKLKDMEIEDIKEKQTNINTKMLNRIINWIDKKEEEAKEEEQNNNEAQIKQFNNQFELYAGEELSYEHIQKLLKLIRKNLSNYSVVSGNEIEIEIEDGKENEERFKEIEGAITDEKKYNVTLKYGEDGYINRINISVYKEKE